MNIKDLFEDVYYGDIDLSSQELTQLPTDLPSHVIGNVYMDNNQLTSLKGCPEIIEGDFNCSLNLITDFSEGPKKVIGSFFGRQFGISFNNFDVRKYTDVKGEIDVQIKLNIF